MTVPPLRRYFSVRRVVALNSLFLILFAALVSFGQVKDTITLYQAIRDGKVVATFKGTGGSSGDAIEVEVAKTPKAGPGPLDLTIPPGSMLHSANGAEQSMVVMGVEGRSTGGGTFAPASHITVSSTRPVTYILSAFCAEFEKENPSTRDTFTLEEPVPMLTCLAREGKTMSIPAQQAAVWQYTDGMTFGRVNEKFTVSQTEWAAASRAVEHCRSATVQPTDGTAAIVDTQAPAVFKTAFTTTKGQFIIEVHRDWAPKGTDRFYNLVRNGFFTDASFFRVIPNFMVQFGIAAEPNIQAAWHSANIEDDPMIQSNKRGFVSFAASLIPNSRTTQVFINLADNPRIDKLGHFTPIGKVIEGMDVVDNLFSGYGEAAPTGKGPSQYRLEHEGKAYIDRDFPKLDQIVRATVLNESVSARIGTEELKPREAITSAPPKPSGDNELSSEDEMVLLGRYSAVIPCLNKQPSCSGVMEVRSDEVAKYCTQSPLDQESARLVNAGACARVLYDRGEYQKALAKLNEIIDGTEKMKQQIRDLQKGLQSKGIQPNLVPAVDDSRDSATEYSLRGRIKYGLLDTDGALTDLWTSLEYYAVYRKNFEKTIVAAENAPLGQVSPDDVVSLRRFYTTPDLDMMEAYIAKAVILYRVGRYADALKDYNEYVAEESKSNGRNVLAQKLGKLIKAHL